LARDHKQRFTIALKQCDGLSGNLRRSWRKGQDQYRCQMGGRAPVTRVVLQFPRWRVTMSNLHRHKDHQQDAQDDCDRLAELETRSRHVPLCYRVPITRARQAGPQRSPDLCLVEATAAPAMYHFVERSEPHVDWDRRGEQRKSEDTPVGSFWGALSAAGRLNGGVNGRNGLATQLQDLRPVVAARMIGTNRLSRRLCAVRRRVSTR
jgi:hypothetical protein